MNDYLSNLAARSLAQADVVLPRPSSLFETAAPAGPIHLEEETVAEPHLPESPAPPSPPPTAAPVAHQPKPDVDAPATPAPPPPDNQEQESSKAPPPPDWLRQLQAVTRRPLPTHWPTTLPPAAAPPQMEPATAPSPEPVPAVAPPAPNQTETVFPSAVTPAPGKIIERWQTETRLVERLERQPLISETVIKENVYPPADPQPVPPQKKAISPPQNGAQKVVVTETRPYTPPVQSIPLPDQRTEQTPPAVHVTIGRVEVRATKPMATAKERPQRARSPVMTLDEYLRQRADGVNR